MEIIIKNVNADRMGWNSCKQGKLYDFSQRGDHADDPCLVVFTLTHRTMISVLEHGASAHFTQ